MDVQSKIVVDAQKKSIFNTCKFSDELIHKLCSESRSKNEGRSTQSKREESFAKFLLYSPCLENKTL